MAEGLVLVPSPIPVSSFNERRLLIFWPLESLSIHLRCTCTFCKLLIINGAGEGNRTLISGLGSPHSTTEPHPLPV